MQDNYLVVVFAARVAAVAVGDDDDEDFQKFLCRFSFIVTKIKLIKNAETHHRCLMSCLNNFVE